MVYPRQNRVDLITEADRDALFHLRSTCYQKQYGANVDISALKWNSWDERFFNLGVFKNDNLISTLRVATLANNPDYKKIMLSDFDSNEFKMPVTILSRAATQEEFRSDGLHSLLRYHALNLAHAAKIPWVLGTFVKDSMRTPQLLEMGYQFSTNPVPWQSFLKNADSSLIVSLDMKKNYEKAKDRLKKNINSNLEIYPALFNSDLLVKKMQSSF